MPFHLWDSIPIAQRGVAIALFICTFAAVPGLFCMSVLSPLLGLVAVLYLSGLARAFVVAASHAAPSVAAL